MQHTQTTRDGPEYLTTEEVAARLRVSAQLLHRWRSKRRGPPFVQVGRVIRYPSALLARWQADHISSRDGAAAKEPSA